MTNIPEASCSTTVAIDPHLQDSPRYIVHEAWHSPLLGTSRSIFVYLPEAYFAEPEALFPVLLMHDGQNLFDGRLSHAPGQTWQAHIAADNLTRAGKLPPTILVGIANVGAGRLHEYTPDADRNVTGGGGPLYVRHIIQELLPEIRRLYRISPRREDTAIAGSSLGALVSLYAGLNHADVFGAVGALSPSLWWNNRSIIRSLHDGLPTSHQRPRIWLDIGALEGDTHVRDTERFARALHGFGWRSHEDLEFRCFEDAGHSEADWAARLPDVLQFLFPVTERA